MIATLEQGRTLRRVGYYADPLGFPPLELYQFGHRFDDIHRRFRTLYCADLTETCLREVLADFRPNLGALCRHIVVRGDQRGSVGAEPEVTATGGKIRRSGRRLGAQDAGSVTPAKLRTASAERGTIPTLDSGSIRAGRTAHRRVQLLPKSNS